MKQRFSTEIRKAPDKKEYIKVFFLDNHDISEYKKILQTCIVVTKLIITLSISNSY